MDNLGPNEIMDNENPLSDLLNSTEISVGSFTYCRVFDLLVSRIILTFFYGAVFLFSFVGNLLVIVVILRSKKMRTVTNFFLGNLAVADFFVGLFCTIPNLTIFLEKHWYFGWVMCKLVFFTQAMCYTASVALLTVISVERYAAILYPLKLKQITTLCLLRIVVVLIWVTSALLATPILLMYETTTYLGHDYCLTTAKINEKALVASTFLIGYVVPLILMTCMYVRIAMVLWSSSTGKGLTVSTNNSTSSKKSTVTVANKSTEKHSIHHVIGCPLFEDPSSSGVSNDRTANRKLLNNTHNSCLCREIVSAGAEHAEDYLNDWPSKRKRGSAFSMLELGKENKTTNATSAPRHNLVVRRLRNQSNNSSTCDNAVLLARRRIIRLLVAVISSFAICVLPYYATKLWLISDPGPTNPTKEIIHATAFLLYYLNSALNPVLYAFLSQNFRRSLTDVCVFSRQRMRKASYTGASRTIHLTNSTL